jgi:hypothetical protein
MDETLAEEAARMIHELPHFGSWTEHQRSDWLEWKHDILHRLELETTRGEDQSAPGRAPAG